MDKESTDFRQGVQSFEQGLGLVLALVSSELCEFSLTEISKLSKMSTSKAHRYLVSLIRAGVVSQDATSGRYQITPLMIEIGLAAQARLDPLAAAEQTLNALHDEVLLPVAASIWSSLGPVLVRKAEARYPMVLGTRVGELMPLTTSSIGRAFAAFGAPDLVETVLEREFAVRGQQTRGATKPSKLVFKRIVRQTRSQGFAHQKGGMLPQLEAVAVPVFSAQGNVELCLSIVAIKGQHDFGADSNLVSTLRSAAANLSRTLGYVGDN